MNINKLEPFKLYLVYFMQTGTVVHLDGKSYKVGFSTYAASTIIKDYNGNLWDIKINKNKVRLIKIKKLPAHTQFTPIDTILQAIDDQIKYTLCDPLASHNKNQYIDLTLKKPRN
jgi:hypothetical protein